MLRVFLIYTLLAGISILVHIQLVPYAYDDAYIHIRIADHLLQYGVPYFNPDEPVKASSSSGWTLLLAGLFAIVGTSPFVIAIFNALITTAGAFVFTRLVQDLTRNSLHNAFYWAAPPLYIALTIRSSIGLMETPLALLLVGSALLLLLKQHAYGFVLLSAAVFFRLEFAVFFLLFAAYTLLRRRFALHLVLVYSAIGALPFLAYDLAFFQTIIPNTVAAKSVVYDLSYGRSIQSMFIFLTSNGLSLLLILTSTLILFVLSAVSAAQAVREQTLINDDTRAFLYLMLLAGVAILSAYILRRLYIFGWYVPLFAVPMVLSFYGIALRGKSGVQRVVLALLVITLYGDLALTTYAAFLQPSAYQDFGTGARVRKYIQVGSDLFQQYPDATLMTSEIGGLGYGFKGRVVDGAGLISPDALKYHPMRVPEERSDGQTGAIPVGYIEEVQPELIVSYDNFIEAFLQSEALQQYERIKEPIYVAEDLAQTDIDAVWGSRHLNVFIRRDILEQQRGAP